MKTLKTALLMALGFLCAQPQRWSDMRWLIMALAITYMMAVEIELMKRPK